MAGETEVRGMLSKLAKPMVVTWMLTLVACGNDPQPQNEELDAAHYRCLGTFDDGGCYSMPANCPVTIPHSSEPNCPEGTSLIPVEEDHCTRKLICVD
jgi:hypothetical protein